MSQRRQPDEPKNIYNVSYQEIAKRQFFAGFMAGIGGVAATLIMGFLISVIFVKILAPQFQNILTSLRTTLEGAGFIMANPSTPNPNRNHK